MERDVMPKRLWALGAVVLGSMLFLSIGCEITVDVGDSGDGDAGSTETRDDSFSVGASPVLVVTSENGSIDVETGPAGTIRVQATLRNANRVQYEVSEQGDTVTVEADVDSGARNAGADIIVTAPAETEVELETSNGRIELQGLEASGALRTSNGRVVIKDVEGDFDVRTSNGSIEVTSMEGVGTLKTSNGPVTLDKVKGAFDVGTSNGNISFSGEMIPGGDNRLETSNGSVTVELQGTPSVELDASTSRGNVTNELPIDASTKNAKRLVGTIGNGEAELVIRASNGSVTIR
jgi:DUF4097 and DUF4098 domain-containing protein YvlB